MPNEDHARDERKLGVTRSRDGAQRATGRWCRRSWAERVSLTTAHEATETARERERDGSPAPGGEAGNQRGGGGGEQAGGLGTEGRRAHAPKQTPALLCYYCSFPQVASALRFRRSAPGTPARAIGGRPASAPAMVAPGRVEWRSKGVCVLSSACGGAGTGGEAREPASRATAQQASAAASMAAAKRGDGGPAGGSRRAGRGREEDEADGPGQRRLLDCGGEHKVTGPTGAEHERRRAVDGTGWTGTEGIDRYGVPEAVRQRSCAVSQQQKGVARQAGQQRRGPAAEAESCERQAQT